MSRYTQFRNLVSGYHYARRLPLVGAPIGNLVETAYHLHKREHLLNHPHVNFKRNFVFIHVPKAAGTSLTRALDMEAPLTVEGHTKARDFVPFLKRLKPEMRAIAFVRNPYDRFISLYTYARVVKSLYHSATDPTQAPKGKHPDYDMLKDKSLEECAILLVEGKLLSIHWPAQVEWLVDLNQNMLVDFIGRVENLEEDLKKLTTCLGIPTKSAPRVNQTNSNDKPEWTERTRDLVRLYYKRDFEMLGYSEDY